MYVFRCGAELWTCYGKGGKTCVNSHGVKFRYKLSAVLNNSDAFFPSALVQVVEEVDHVYMKDKCLGYCFGHYSNKMY